MDAGRGKKNVKRKPTTGCINLADANAVHGRAFAVARSRMKRHTIADGGENGRPFSRTPRRTYDFCGVICCGRREKRVLRPSPYATMEYVGFRRFVSSTTDFVLKSCRASVCFGRVGFRASFSFIRLIQS